ncbi:MAG TPA: PIN domain-containing protein [Armatimonadota bacterium]|nr:PIN domain-containing protein [Armatimonadota bacterium]
MKLRVYLDTSVLSAYCDERAPERMAETKEFWARLSEVEASTSDLVLDEIERTPDEDRRSVMLALLADTARIPVTQEMHELADRYIRHDLFGPVMYNDALHVAAAVLSRQDILLSWNFKHLVNRRKRAQVNEVNILLGLPTIEILAPSEL